jgi:hypothetical protein
VLARYQLTTAKSYTLPTLPARYRIKDALLEAKIRITDWNGHMKRGSYWLEDFWNEPPEVREENLLTSSWFFGVSDEKVDELIEALKGGPALTEFVEIETSSNRLLCPFCDKRLDLATDGHILRVSGAPCPLPEGIDHFDVELNIPSGRIVVSDDLREWYKSDHKDENINRLKGRINTTAAYAEINLAVGCIGNSDPGLYRKGGKITIGLKGSSRKGKKNLMPSAPWGRKIAEIRTQLWWYSLADLDDFTERLAYYTPDLSLSDWEKAYGNSVIKVKPGVYRVRWYANFQDTDQGERMAEVEWIRPADPRVDHLTRYKNTRLTALECCIQSVLDWPTLYLPHRTEHGRYEDRLSWEELDESQRLYSIARAADHLMCVLGGGVEWHENGHVLTRVSAETKKFAAGISADGIVPLFEEGYNWYPFSEGYGGMCLGAGLQNHYRQVPEINLNPTFALLSLNIAANYLRYPPKPRLNGEAWPPVFLVSEVRDRMKLALRVYRETRKRYDVGPMDPVFDALAMDAAYDDVIEQCDLGPDHPPEDQWGDPPGILEFEKFKFVEFDASLSQSKDGYCWHPKNPGCSGCWARPEDAQRYAINSNQREEGFYSNAGRSVPLKFVARVVKIVPTHMGPVLEVSFDYGDDKMHGPSACRWAIAKKQADAVRGFNDEEEYEKLLAPMKKVFDDMEQLIETKKKQIFGG